MYGIYCKLRDTKGVKDSDVAKATGIPLSTFTDWKNGRSRPKTGQLIKIADFFGVSIEYFSQERERDYLLKPGAIVTHFKREFLNEEEKIHTNKFAYKILAVADDVNTMEKLVVYKAMYPDEEGEYRVFARPMNEFLSKVDKEKYPESTYTYRFQ